MRPPAGRTANRKYAPPSLLIKMSAPAARRIPPDLLALIDKKVAAGEYRDREDFIAEAVEAMGSRLILEDLQRRYGRKGRLTRREEERIVRLVRKVRG